MQWYKFLIIVIVILSAGFLVSCKKREEVEKRVITTPEVKEEIKETPEKVAGYTQQQKEDYERQTETKLREYDELIRELNTKSAGLNEETRVLYTQKRDEFMNKKNAAYEKLRELKVASPRPWEDI